MLFMYEISHVLRFNFGDLSFSFCHVRGEGGGGGGRSAEYDNQISIANAFLTLADTCIHYR